MDFEFRKNPIALKDWAQTLRRPLMQALLSVGSKKKILEKIMECSGLSAGKRILKSPSRIGDQIEGACIAKLVWDRERLKELKTIDCLD